MQKMPLCQQGCDGPHPHKVLQVPLPIPMLFEPELLDTFQEIKDKAGNHLLPEPTEQDNHYVLLKSWYSYDSNRHSGAKSWGM